MTDNNFHMHAAINSICTKMCMSSVLYEHTLLHRHLSIYLVTQCLPTHVGIYLQLPLFCRSAYATVAEHGMNTMHMCILLHFLNRNWKFKEGLADSRNAFKKSGVPSAENREPLRVPSSAKVTGSKSCKSSVDFRLLLFSSFSRAGNLMI